MPGRIGKGYKGPNGDLMYGGMVPAPAMTLTHLCALRTFTCVSLIMVESDK